MKVNKELINARVDSKVSALDVAAIVYNPKERKKRAGRCA